MIVHFQQSARLIFPPRKIGICGFRKSTTLEGRVRNGDKQINTLDWIQRGNCSHAWNMYIRELAAISCLIFVNKRIKRDAKNCRIGNETIKLNQNRRSKNILEHAMYYLSKHFDHNFTVDKNLLAQILKTPTLALTNSSNLSQANMRDENNPLYLSQSSRHGGSWYSNTLTILLLENNLVLVFNKNIVKT